MPILKFNAIAVHNVCTMSQGLVDDLQKLMQCPREYFSLEVVQSIYVKDAEIISGPPMVEVYWFDRGQEVQDQAAKIITKFIQDTGHPDVDVIFFALAENRYYENGEHF